MTWRQLITQVYKKKIYARLLKSLQPLTHAYKKLFVLVKNYTALIVEGTFGIFGSNSRNRKFFTLPRYARTYISLVFKVIHKKEGEIKSFVANISRKQQHETRKLLPVQCTRWSSNSSDFPSKLVLLNMQIVYGPQFWQYSLKTYDLMRCIAKLLTLPSDWQEASTITFV